jgi:hypothetical protein
MLALGKTVQCRDGDKISCGVTSGPKKARTSHPPYAGQPRNPEKNGAAEPVKNSPLGQISRLRVQQHHV